MKGVAELKRRDFSFPPNRPFSSARFSLVFTGVGGSSFLFCTPNYRLNIPQGDWSKEHSIGDHPALNPSYLLRPLGVEPRLRRKVDL